MKRSPAKSVRLCACGARATVGDLCAKHDADVWRGVWQERRWSDDDRAAVLAVLSAWRAA